ncbi:MAG: precorrin-2 dehydrogenase/sirohydrochlorin ferrochelatase family protein [Acidimicrobiales bacterium]
MFPLVLDLSRQTVLVVGAGEVGARKAAQLIAGGARVRVIAKEVLAKLPEGVESVHQRAYRRGDLGSAVLVVVATGDDQVNDQIVQEAHARGVLVNVVDDPERSNFYFTAVHRDGDVIVSVSSSGASPALAQWIRDRATRALPRNLGAVARQLREERAALHARSESTEERNWTARVEQLVNEL